MTNVVLDHKRAAELTLRHLYQLGHRQVAFMRGQPFSSDSDDRWRSIVATARELDLEIRPELTIQLERDLTSPELGYPVVQQLLQHRQRPDRTWYTPLPLHRGPTAFEGRYHPNRIQCMPLALLDSR